MVRCHAGFEHQSTRTTTMTKKNLTQKLPKPDTRQALLISRRNARMARSAHAYVRGNTSKFYEWLDGMEGHALPEGPAIWICGDCHTGNLGPSRLRPDGRADTDAGRPRRPRRRRCRSCSPACPRAARAARATRASAGRSRSGCAASVQSGRVRSRSSRIRRCAAPSLRSSRNSHGLVPGMALLRSTEITSMSVSPLCRRAWRARMISRRRDETSSVFREPARSLPAAESIVGHNPSPATRRPHAKGFWPMRAGACSQVLPA